MKSDIKTDELHAMRHSLAHIMATAVTHIWPNVRLGVGPVVENGFYYDIDIPGVTISDADFKKIESEMRKVIKAAQTFELSSKPVSDAVKWAQDNKQPFKEELLNDLKREGTTVAKDIDPETLGLESGDSKVDSVTFYTNGDFTDLCRGPHVESTDKVGAFKLMRVAGAYWRGKDTNPQMQRLYGVAFATEKELTDYLNMLEEAKKRDHRKLGQDLDLFTFSELIGPGLPLFTPRGTILRNAIEGYSQELQSQAGYQRVAIPHIAKIDLYKTSGHYDKYPERFSVTSFESDTEFMMKPMNCPHHTQIYASRQRSYRDLPIRYMENTMVYRDEKAGELHGLSRVRAATQDDGHVFCTLEQAEGEFTSIMKMIREMYSTFGLKWRARLSFRDDSDKYLGDPELWEKAQATIEKVAKDLGLDYFIGEGEAAFYGPKIDIMATDALGREWQLATEQLDFVQPSRFGLTYTAEDGSEQTPVMIHKALLGSVERFLSVFIEHTAGKFPTWMAPEQLRIISVNQTDQIVDFANELAESAILSGVRVECDNTNESVGKKIRNAEIMKVPYVVVIGEKELESKSITPRVRADLLQGDPSAVSLEKLIEVICRDIKEKSLESNLNK
jgi:threonyl-tRNA synthetase